MRLVLAIAIAIAACTPTRPRPVLVTTAETSQYTRTGRYDEAVRLCKDFARAYEHVHCETIGTSGEGRPILALRIAKRPELPAIYFQAGIHAGEIEGKDAGFWFLRDLLDGKVVPGALDKVSIVFVPVMNPDGHERFGKNHRPNQRGPEEMGWRTNGARLNLNRDWVKADAPETQAVLSMLRKRDPVLAVDLHTTDGAKFEHDISFVSGPWAPRTDRLDEASHALNRWLMERMTQLGHLPLPFYPSFVKDDDPLSGFAEGEAPPRFSQFYAAARDRLGILVETHSWRTYKERAQSTYHAMQAILEDATHHAADWRAATMDAEAANMKLGGSPITLAWDDGKSTREIEFRGYSFEKQTSELTGGTYIVYDESKPQIWKVPLYTGSAPRVTITAPRGGYLVDGGFARAVAAVLDRHGIYYEPVAGEPRATVEAFRATSAKFLPPYEGRTRAEIVGAWAPETRTLDRGAIFVPIGQARARLAMHLLEPALPDSLAAWGVFNVMFEQKEYIESYVIEAEAAKMIADRPALKAELDAAVAADPELAKSPDAKRDWLYKRHPSWDERVNLLPVYRTAEDFRTPVAAR